MKIPFSFLQSFFTRRLDVARVAESLTSIGLEIESIERGAHFGEYVKVGEVLTVEKHPHADRLKVTTVQVAAQDIRTIVCGAPNVAVGQKVVVALPGAVLPNGLHIQNAIIRGTESSGMICAEDELGIGSNHNGILVLDPVTKIGTPADQCDVTETILEAEVTTNRPDWLSLLGVARELGSVLRIPIQMPDEKFREVSAKCIKPYKVEVQKGTAEAYYLRRFQNVKNADAPAWISKRVQNCGGTSQNAVVDITNYVLFEYGQPLHAFDADKIRGSRIRVRFAKAGESIQLLDTKSYHLQSEDIVIADSKGPIALAGIMGGSLSAITSETTNVLLESAIFPSKYIRKTAKRLGIVTEARDRFERGIPLDLPLHAVNRAAELVTTAGIAQACKGLIVGKKPAFKQRQIIVSPARMKKMIGLPMTQTLVKSVLERLHFTVTKAPKGSYKVTPPAFRSDIHIEADVAEEVTRLVGYTAIPTEYPSMHLLVGKKEAIVDFSDQVRMYLASSGYTEIYTHSMYGDRQLALTFMPADSHRQLVNPISGDEKYLRAELSPNVIEAVVQNRKEFPSVQLFEIGQVFSKFTVPGTQSWHLAISVSYRSEGAWISILNDFSKLFAQLLHRNPEDIIIGSGGHTRDIKVGTEVVGYISARHVGSVTVAIVECSVDELLKLQLTEKSKWISKYPRVLRDIAIVVSDASDFLTIQRQLRRGSLLLTSIQLFDATPQGEHLVSYAFHLEFQAKDRTLSSSEIEHEMKTITSCIQEKGGKVRT